LITWALPKTYVIWFSEYIMWSIKLLKARNDKHTRGKHHCFKSSTVHIVGGGKKGKCQISHLTYISHPSRRSEVVIFVRDRFPSLNTKVRSSPAYSRKEKHRLPPYCRSTKMGYSK